MIYILKLRVGRTDGFVMFAFYFIAFGPKFNCVNVFHRIKPQGHIKTFGRFQIRQFLITGDLHELK